MGNRVRLIFVAELLAALTAVTTNVATNVLPDSWRPYLWLAWPVLAVLVAVGIVLAVLVHRADSVRGPGSPERTVYYRRAMVARLRRVWVEDALERTLFRRTLVELGLTERPDLLQRSWDVVVDVPDEEPRPLGRDIPLADVVERHRSLLVLGAPGAGKTTMLLAFLRDQLDRAEQDGIVPIPVVFQLASWAAEGKPMAEWFADELSGPRYGLPPDLALDWIAGDRVLPLLDGLDEVPLDRRIACARAIDAFHRSHRLLPLLVTSRSTDYDALGLRMSLGAALVIKPLDPTQIDQHLSRLGASLAGLREAIRRQPPLAELLSSPFLLDVAIRAYHDLPASEVPDRPGPAQWQATLFSTFVNRALRRRETGPVLEAPDVVRMLAFIARALGQKLETSFFLESVDPTWLPALGRRVLKVATAFPAVMLVGGAAGMLAGLVLGLPAGIASGGLAAAMTAAVLVLAQENPPLTYGGSGNRVVGMVHHVRKLAVGAVVASVALGLIAGLCGALLELAVLPREIGDATGRWLIAGGSFIDVLGSWAYVAAVAGALTGAVVSAVHKADAADRSALRGRPIGAGLRDTAWTWGIITAATGLPATVMLGGAFGSPGLLAGILLALAFGYTRSGRSLVEYWIRVCPDFG
ncbi:NACHT domain-containing protein [Amycolatopsis sp. NPDC051758]|uniref:NACHT domain-containing protein n=1 Tax=Amycolatopsis sp. NPDC051758 TaxID=3363935 RepID=UPI0037A5DD90